MMVHVVRSRESECFARLVVKADPFNALMVEHVCMEGLLLPW